MGNETIGYRIRRARMFRGVTQAELARQIGLSAKARPYPCTRGRCHPANIPVFAGQCGFSFMLKR